MNDGDFKSRLDALINETDQKKHTLATEFLGLLSPDRQAEAMAKAVEGSHVLTQLDTLKNVWEMLTGSPWREDDSVTAA